MFGFIVTNKETNYDDEEEDKQGKFQSQFLEIAEMRKGRALAIKKLRAAKEKTESKKNEKEVIEVRIIGLLGKLGGINHKVIKEDTENDYVDEKADFIELLTDRIATMDIGMNIKDLGIKVKLNSILSNIIDVAESETTEDNKTEAISILQCKL